MSAPQYPWKEGDPLFASALNGAIASASAGSGPLGGTLTLVTTGQGMIGAQASDVTQTPAYIQISRSGTGHNGDAALIDSRLTFSEVNEGYLWGFHNGVFSTTVNGSPSSVGSALIAELNVNASESTNPGPFVFPKSQFTAFEQRATKNLPPGGYGAGKGPVMWASYCTLDDTTNLPSSKSNGMLNEWDLVGNNRDDNTSVSRTGLIFVYQEHTPVVGGSGMPFEWGNGITFVNANANIMPRVLINAAANSSVAAIDFRGNRRGHASVTATAAAGATTIAVDNVLWFTTAGVTTAPVSPTNTSLIQIGTRVYTQTGIGSLTAGTYAGTITIAAPGIVGTDGAIGSHAVPNAHTMWLSQASTDPWDGGSIAFVDDGSVVMRYSSSTSSVEFNNRITGSAPGGIQLQPITGSITGSGNFTCGSNLTVAASATFGGNIGFYGTAPNAKPTVTGAKDGNAALTSLILALKNFGLIVDSTS